MTVKLKTKLKIIAVQVIVFCHAPLALAEDSVEFNTDVLDAADRSHVDLSRFATDNYIAPGDYLLDITINGKAIGQSKIHYDATADGKSSRACITQDLLDKLALKDEIRAKVTEVYQNCYSIDSIPGAKVTNTAGALNLAVPQAWMKYNDPDWTPPERWDSGIAGVIFDYSVTGQLTHRFKGEGDYDSLSGYGQTGFNVGGWRMRADYQANYDNKEHKSNFTWNQFYAYRPLPTMAAKLTLGEIYLNSRVFDTVRFTGINLESDERMLPPSLQGYAPEIHGVARTNAKVTVSQSGRVIYETTVAAGPFNIQDLRNAIRGTLDVRVEEQDGSVSTFQVTTANIPYLTRPGYVRYNVAGGAPSRYNHRIKGPGFVAGDFSWGISNAWSVYGGLMTAGKAYTAITAGIGRDLNVFGALSFDATESWSEQPDENRIWGTSYKLSYAKTFDEFDSSITFAGYRFSERDFRTLSQYLDERYGGYDNLGREKEMYTITGSKTFWADDPRMATTLFLTYTHQNYWNRGSQDRYGMSVGRSFNIGNVRGITANLSAYRSEYNGKNDDSIAFSLSIPVGDSKWAGLDIQTNNSKVSPMASYTDNSDYNNLWRVRAGANQDGRASFDGYYMHRSQLAEINTTASYQYDDYIAVSGTLRGGLTATRHGAALHNSGATADTARMMVDTSGIGGVPLNRGMARTNSFGIAVVPDIVSYNSFDTRVDVDAMDSNIEASKAINTSVLTEGAIGYQVFGMSKGNKLMATLRLADHSTPPFGAEVYNKDGVSVAMVLEEGKAWLAGVNPNETLKVNWGGKNQCEITMPATITDSSTILLPCR
ncbi:fimbria/pilus outer membrane usher protein [Enterobacteriaceae bacterium YMB-R22]|jgi:outer membrane usher protein PapC|uniref:fimbria/pilus outer membrane usher protein n=1 Tax=Tenebrionicola larvae TaxID=2815733 RepID=UPI00201310D4|nr:fimbria/pilus outer membrane usher protein [Tenebrionicola larvae]MBV4414028.1 fimbria/pilus outer membrane usher protein [Tenebrionicola larvae]